MKTTDMNYTPIQLKFPVDMERIIKINDPVYSFSEVMAHIDLKKYFVEKERETGRPRYDREKLLKIVLFAFMEYGYCSLRFIEKLCETDIRFLRSAPVKGNQFGRTEEYYQCEDCTSCLHREKCHKSK